MLPLSSSVHNKIAHPKKQNNDLHTQYRGRFAPSPSGHLHFGSLIAALASFLDAKNQQGVWLVRIEDIDPPREQQGASSHILTTLETYGLHWDETVLYQSQQADFYRDILNDLSKTGHSYYCKCTRADIKKLGGTYQGHCKTLNNSCVNSAIRLNNSHAISQFDDLIQGQVLCDKTLAHEDFIIHRKDGLFAYQLAVVVDDIYQNINHVIRGCDLLEPTARQLSLFATLNVQAPQYGHVPLAVTKHGFKLSKQNKAAAISLENPRFTLLLALNFLQQSPPIELSTCSVNEIINWAILHWKRDNIPKSLAITC